MKPDDRADGLKPELLNRLDDVIVFKSLAKDSVERILDLELAQVQARLQAKGISFTLSGDARKFLLEKGFDVANGARHIRRTIERFLQDPLAEAIIDGRVQEAATVMIDKDKDADGLAFNANAPSPAAST